MFQNAGFDGVTANHEDKFQKLSLNYKATSAGWLYVFVANESNKNKDVWFDDIRITHEQNATSFKVTQVNEYYPFGLPTSNTWQRPGYVSPGKLYQGLFAGYDSIVGQYEFLSRTYDPALGRFMQVDPAGQFANPYLGMGNMPHFVVDPNGEFSFVGATILALVGGYSGGVISSGSWNPGDWEGKDWMWVGVGAGVGFVGGGFLGEALHSTSSHVYSGQANAWDRFTSIFGEGSVNKAGNRYIADAPRVGNLKYPNFSGWLSKTFEVPNTGHSSFENTTQIFDVLPMKFSKAHVKRISFAVNTSTVVFEVFNGGNQIFSNENLNILNTPNYRNNGNVFRPVVTKTFPPTNSEITSQEIQELIDMGINPDTLLENVPVPGTNINIRVNLRVKNINYYSTRLKGWK